MTSKSKPDKFGRHIVMPPADGSASQLHKRATREAELFYADVFGPYKDGLARMDAPTKTPRQLGQ